MGGTGRTTVTDARGRDHDALRADPSCVHVGGPGASPWANPYRPGMTWAEACAVTGGPTVAGAPYEALDAAACVNWFRYRLMAREDLLGRLGELRGKVLVCSCCDWGGEGEPDAPCHAVVLARLADDDSRARREGQEGVEEGAGAAGPAREGRPEGVRELPRGTRVRGPEAERDHREI
jgi:hypothetical protein